MFIGQVSSLLKSSQIDVNLFFSLHGHNSADINSQSSVIFISGPSPHVEYTSIKYRLGWLKNQLWCAVLSAYMFIGPNNRLFGLVGTLLEL